MCSRRKDQVPAGQEQAWTPEGGGPAVSTGTTDVEPDSGKPGQPWASRPHDPTTGALTSVRMGPAHFPRQISIPLRPLLPRQAQLLIPTPEFQDGDQGPLTPSSVDRTSGGIMIAGLPCSWWEGSLRRTKPLQTCVKRVDSCFLPRFPQPGSL